MRSLLPLLRNFVGSTTIISVLIPYAQAATCTLVVTPSSSPFSMVEGGSQLKVEVSLAGCPHNASPPSGDVTISISESSANLVGTFTATSVVIPAGSFTTPVSLTITPIDDFEDKDNSFTSSLTFAASSHHPQDTIVPFTLSGVVYTDNDSSHVVLSTSALSTYSEGQSDSFTLRLSSIPTAPVTIATQSSNPEKVVVTPSTLVFDKNTWSTPQAVTARGSYAPITSAENQSISLSVSSSDAKYTNLSIPKVSVTHTPARFIYTKAQLVTSAAGGSDSVGISLAQQPVAPVMLTASARDASLFTVEAASFSLHSSSALAGQEAAASAILTFTPSNWSTPQYISARGKANEESVTMQTSFVDFSLSSSDPSFTSVVPIPVEVKHTPGLVSFASFPVELHATGGETEVEVRLARQPSSTVYVSFGPDQAPFFSVREPANRSLQFTPSTWDIPQKLILQTGSETSVQQKTATLVMMFASQDPFFNDASIPITMVKHPPYVQIDTTTLVTNDNGGSSRFSIALARQPQSDVVVTLSRSSKRWIVVKPRQLVFTPATWNIPQPVEVVGTIGEISEPQRTSLKILMDSQDPYFAGIEQRNALTVTHDLARLLTLSALDQSLNEHLSARFRVGLKKPPQDKVTISIEASQEGLHIEPSELEFTASSWQTTHLVTIRRDTLEGLLPPTTVTFTPDQSDEFSPVRATLAVEKSENGKQELTLTRLHFGAGFYGSSSNDRSEAEQTASDDLYLLGKGEEAFLSIRLAQQPIAEVIVRPSLRSSAEANFGLVAGTGMGEGPQELRFTPENWHLPQVLTVKAQGGEEPAGATKQEAPHTDISFALTSRDPYFDGAVVKSKTISYHEVNKKTRQGSCFVATAAFRDPHAVEVKVLQGFRDKVLMRFAVGRFLTRQYYAVGPQLATYIAPYPLARAAVRGVLYPLVWSIQYPLFALMVSVLIGLAGYILLHRRIS